MFSLHLGDGFIFQRVRPFRMEPFHVSPQQLMNTSVVVKTEIVSDDDQTSSSERSQQKWRGSSRVKITPTRTEKPNSPLNAAASERSNSLSDLSQLTRGGPEMAGTAAPLQLTQDRTDLLTDSMNAILETKPRERGNRAVNFCPQCGKYFPSTCHLKRHVMLHLGYRPFKCTFCEKSFSRRDKWKDHEKMHLRKTCHSCGEMFVKACDYKRHLCTKASSSPTALADVIGQNFAPPPIRPATNERAVHVRKSLIKHKIVSPSKITANGLSLPSQSNHGYLSSYTSTPLDHNAFIGQNFTPPTFDDPIGQFENHSDSIVSESSFANGEEPIPFPVENPDACSCTVHSCSRAQSQDRQRGLAKDFECRLRAIETCVRGLRDVFDAWQEAEFGAGSSSEAI